MTKKEHFPVNLEAIQDIYNTFAKMADCKREIATAEDARGKYASTVNELMSITVADIDRGYELSMLALQLAEQIQRGEEAKESLEIFQAELNEKYGFLYPEDQIKEAV